jgi:hypothetical protein
MVFKHGVYVCAGGVVKVGFISPSQPHAKRTIHGCQDTIAASAVDIFPNLSASWLPVSGGLGNYLARNCAHSLARPLGQAFPQCPTR